MATKRQIQIVENFIKNETKRLMKKNRLNEDDRVIYGGDVKDVADYKNLIIKRLEHDVNEISNYIRSKRFDELINKMFEAGVRTKESSPYILYQWYGEINDQYSEESLN